MPSSWHGSSMPLGGFPSGSPGFGSATASGSAMSLPDSPLGAQTMLMGLDVQITPLTPLNGAEGSQISFKVVLPASAVESGSFGRPAASINQQFSIAFGNTVLIPRLLVEPGPTASQSAVLLTAVVPEIGIAKPSDPSDVPVSIQIRFAGSRSVALYTAGSFSFGKSMPLATRRTATDAALIDSAENRPGSRKRGADDSSDMWNMMTPASKMPEHGHEQLRVGASSPISSTFSMPSARRHMAAPGMVESLFHDHRTTSRLPSRAMADLRTGSPIVGGIPVRDPSLSQLQTPSASVQLVRAPQSSSSSDPGEKVLNSPSANPRARLELHGDLSDMAVGWTVNEWQTGRRLVQFWRKQEGTSIHATFRPILPDQYVPNSIVVSCIFREDRNECFITSVDTIYLLEALVASRFSIEEKNRIRRNLEGFRPETVSKHKKGTEAFFKRIMSFPDPKPRNIEKDVKTFPWRILGPALSKVVSKYVGQDADGTFSAHHRTDSDSSISFTM